MGEPTPPSSSGVHETIPTALIRDALAHLDDVAYLARHPLAARRGVVAARQDSGRALRAELMDTIELLRPEGRRAPDGHDWRSYRILRRQYVDGVSPRRSG